VKLRAHLFEWPSRHNVHLMLPVMLVLSFFLHGACLFIFQASFPRSEGSRERTATVYHPLPGSQEAAKLAPMLAASDPALFSSPKIFGQRVGEFPKTAYVASFDKETPTLAPLPTPSPSHFLPPERGTAPVAVAALTPKASPQRNPATPTSVRFGGALERRSWTPPQGFDFSALAVLPRQGLSPAEFLVAVSPDGFPMYFFPQRSSGNEALDRAALKYLAACRFAEAPSAREATWGTATFIWGADIKQDSEQ
jgi:hypothetical protein